MKYKIYYDASIDEHAPDIRDDNIIIEAESAQEARKKAYRHPGVKGFVYLVVEHEIEDIGPQRAE